MVIINFAKYKESKLDKGVSVRVEAYRKIVESMDDYDRLDEMVRFRDRMDKADKLNEEYLQKGIILFKCLTNKAHTDEMRNLTKSFLKNLELEYETLKKGITA